MFFFIFLIHVFLSTHIKLQWIFTLNQWTRHIYLHYQENNYNRITRHIFICIYHNTFFGTLFCYLNNRGVSIQIDKTVNPLIFCFHHSLKWAIKLIKRILGKSGENPALGIYLYQSDKARVFVCFFSGITSEIKKCCSNRKSYIQLEFLNHWYEQGPTFCWSYSTNHGHFDPFQGRPHVQFILLLYPLKLRK